MSTAHDDALDRMTDWAEPVKILKEPKALVKDPKRDRIKEES